MVTVTEFKDNTEVQELSHEDFLREERRRTGRYVATVIAIFVSLFGLYQAMARGTPEYAAFFLPALIMFFYVLWILYASRARAKIQKEEMLNQGNDEDNTLKTVETTSRTHYPLARSYSIA